MAPDYKFAHQESVYTDFRIPLHNVVLEHFDKHGVAHFYKQSGTVYYKLVCTQHYRPARGMELGDKPAGHHLDDKLFDHFRYDKLVVQVDSDTLVCSELQFDRLFVESAGNSVLEPDYRLAHFGNYTAAHIVFHTAVLGHFDRTHEAVTNDTPLYTGFRYDKPAPE